MHTSILAADWSRLGDTYKQAISDTLVMVAVTLVAAGIFGLVLGTLLYTTRKGAILENRIVYALINFLVNLVRPIPFIILISAIGPLTIAVVGTQIGREAAMFGMSIAASFAVARIVEQNLVSIDPGVIEAARAMGASPWKIITSVIIPEALGPLILGYTFISIAIVDMSSMAGYIGGGGLGDFAITYGYRAYDWQVTLVATVTIIILVQFIQIFGNWLSKKIMRR
ncbi:ABC transporter permease [Corynebacterium sp. sy017]|uniref:methionine ABC transporter permease n=1 Tax=unclassified Corynebacterium TaxID=2624378 RepID=UPI00118552C5|nr:MULTISPECIES: methionine ABC transporter permease [unclassified Corynebacterium]MBP3088677.1 ABC transporter permease [Corynebacterium sp. sy017]TSD91966.1 ABC transporter permease [Corynebacterium sp. SY003]